MGSASGERRATVTSCLLVALAVVILAAGGCGGSDDSAGGGDSGGEGGAGSAAPPSPSESAEEAQAAPGLPDAVAARMTELCRAARRTISPGTPIRTRFERAELATAQAGALVGLGDAVAELRGVPSEAAGDLRDYLDLLSQSTEVTTQLAEVAGGPEPEPDQVALLVREQKRLRAERQSIAAGLGAPEC